MSKNITSNTEQKSTHQRDCGALSTIDVSNAPSNKPNGTKNGQQAGRHTQQQDDEDGYPRNWYSPKNPRVKTSLQMKGWQEHYSFITAIVSILALAVISWQGYIYVKQTRLMDKQNTEARITRELENRPWVGIKDVFFEPSPTGGYRIGGTYVNGGNSPALCTIEIRSAVAENSPPDDFQLATSPKKGSIFALLPNSENKAQIGYIEAPPPLARYPDGTGQALYIIGKIDYKDAFGQSHVTRFCYFAHGITPEKNNAKVVGASFALCPTHNKFD